MRKVLVCIPWWHVKKKLDLPLHFGSYQIITFLDVQIELTPWAASGFSLVGSWYGVSNRSARVSDVNLIPELTCATITSFPDVKARVDCSDHEMAIGRFLQLVSRANPPDFMEMDVIVRDFGKNFSSVKDIHHQGQI